MNTTITFHPHPVESTLDHLQAATSHPLHRQSFREECSDGSTEHLIVFGSEDVELARFIFLSDAAGQPTLESVTGNLPVLLWGHDGRIIQDQAEYQTALTRLRWLGSHLVSEDDIDLLLPHVCESNRGFIGELGLVIQLADTDREIFRDARYSFVRGSGLCPILAKNYVILEGTQATWHIASLPETDEYVLERDPGAEVIRLECLVRDIDLLAKAAGIPQPERFLVAALPWSALWPLHLEVMKATLGGELGDGRLHDQLLESCPRDVLCDLLDPAREDAHEALLKSLGCPMGEDYEVDQTFCGHLFLERRDREQRVFFTLGSGLPH